jgi:predicted SAM-dependent methyltransferase
MRRTISKLLGLLGYSAARTSDLKKYSVSQLQNMYDLDGSEISILKEKTGLFGLKKLLIESGQTRWLEIGCGGNFEENFTYVDIIPEETINRPGRYFQINMTSKDKSALKAFEKFDFVRLQHVFEHFTPEDGLTVLENIAFLLKDDGYMLLSVPDLEKFILLYRNGKIKDYYNWALKRVEPDAPRSFYFSVYAHSILSEQHKWCYDAEGLKYIVDRSGMFYDITQLQLGDEFSSIPFTHNRPVEDLVVLARKRRSE